jgi:S-adenosylmethionine-dependent methyltransferase
MTMPERLAAIERTWNMLPAGGLWAVIDTPNRLWHFDSHTSLLPFFHWLPDELAFRYSRFSDRPRFNDLYRQPSAESLLHFLRRGRGVSFHELEVALGSLDRWEVAGWLDWRAKTRSRLQRLMEIASADSHYRRVLRRLAPGVHEAFLQPRLDFAIRKRA